MVNYRVVHLYLLPGGVPAAAWRPTVKCINRRKTRALGRTPAQQTFITFIQIIYGATWPEAARREPRRRRLAAALLAQLAHRKACNDASFASKRFYVL
jgi:hypothetical protein